MPMSGFLTHERVGRTLLVAAVPLFGRSAAAFGDPGWASFKVNVPPESPAEIQGQDVSYAAVLIAKETFAGFVDLSTSLDPPATGLTLEVTGNHVRLDPGTGAAMPRVDER